MKSKKPFLIVFAAALTLALVLPFMGLFSFAEDDLTLPVTQDSGWGVQFYSGSVLSSSSSSSYNVTFPLDATIRVQMAATTSYLDGQFCSIYLKYFNSDYPNGRLIYLSTDSSNPTVLPDDITQITIERNTPNQPTTQYYFVIPSPPPPPDPLAPVSDGMDTMISVFGDVIDYIINTPDVAIFVAISVASCAIIPMGIILIKKLIKGY